MEVLNTVHEHSLGYLIVFMHMYMNIFLKLQLTLSNPYGTVLNTYPVLTELGGHSTLKVTDGRVVRADVSVTRNELS